MYTTLYEIGDDKLILLESGLYKAFIRETRYYLQTFILQNGDGLIPDVEYQIRPEDLELIVEALLVRRAT